MSQILVNFMCYSCLLCKLDQRMRERGRWILQGFSQPTSLIVMHVQIVSANRHGHPGLQTIRRKSNATAICRTKQPASSLHLDICSAFGTQHPRPCCRTRLFQCHRSLMAYNILNRLFDQQLMTATTGDVSSDSAQLASLHTSWSS